MTHQFEKKQGRKKTQYVVSPEVAGTKPVPLMAARIELFTPVDEDNIDSTPFLEEVAVVAAEAWISELLDPKKGTHQYNSKKMSVSCTILYQKNCESHL